MESYSSFVASRGFLKSCGARNRQAVSSTNVIDDDLVARHQPYGSIYVCTTALPGFAGHVVDQITTPFVLVSGDSDVPVSEAVLGSPTLDRILNHPHLQAWFAQNLAHAHPKLHHLPIGLDYHTAFERPGLFGLSSVSPIAQEHQLLDTLAGSPEFNHRYMVAYCNWHFELERGDRTACRREAESGVCFFEPNRVPRIATWIRQAECMYVLSPEGAGMDCHRTWEALLLGCVPVMRRNLLAPLFERLPVLMVDAWSDVTRDRLMSYLQHLQTARFDFSSLFQAYWVARISGRVPSSMEDMTFSDFRRRLTRITG